jgi:mono/diheme cytochrome c family protein
MSDSEKVNPNPLNASKMQGQNELSDDSLQRVHAQILRDKPEPKEGFSPIPIFLLFIFSALIFFGGIYMAKYSAGFSALAFNETVHRGRHGESQAPSPPDPLVLGKRWFTEQCKLCHQATGQGIPMAFPPLVGSDWLLGSEEIPIRIVLNGLIGEIEVNGATFNSLMPPLGAVFDDAQIAQVLSYVRQEWGNAAEPVLPETVAAIRAKTADRTTNWTAAELEEFK